MTEESTGRRDGHGFAEMNLWDAEVFKLGVTEAMDVLSRGVAAVVHAAPTVPSRTCVRFGCASIEVEWPATAAPEPGPVTAEPPERTERHVVRAPLVGTFYRAPEPGSRPFVDTGDLVEPGQQVGIVETMKLMTPVTADLLGRVGDILVGDAEAVEFDQPLLVLESTVS
jgi:acetyl-CoA carboxylase biotin carboxyl carrier protein